jgi:hypothetical protein
MEHLEVMDSKNYPDFIAQGLHLAESLARSAAEGIIIS